MQRLGYGRIKHLIVIHGEPMSQPPPKICRRRKLKGPRYRPRPSLPEDYLLKEQVTNLFEELDSMANRIIAIDVRDGLPGDIIDE